MISVEDFAKLDIRIGKVTSAENVEGSEKLIRMKVDFAELGQRIVFAGIREWYKPSDLEGKLLPFVVNIEPKKVMNEESQAMVLAAGENECILLIPDKEVAPGTKVH
jgi:methionine--tRNA ligase beta chain